jgi:hypothetical protein
MSILSRMFDERFLHHRRRSTSVAGIATAQLSILLFAYRYFVDHVWSWDLLAIGLAFVAIKFALMARYYLTE